jgi:hypothetical protein
MKTEIAFAGRRFVRRPSQLIDALFSGPTTPDGLFAPRKNGVLFSRPGGEPVAFLVANPGQSKFFVSCHKQEDGRLRYMFGLSSVGESFLGLAGRRYSEAADIAESVWQEFQAEKISA